VFSKNWHRMCSLSMFSQPWQRNHVLSRLTASLKLRTCSFKIDSERWHRMCSLSMFSQHSWQRNHVLSSWEHLSTAKYYNIGCVLSQHGMCCYMLKIRIYVCLAMASISHPRRCSLTDVGVLFWISKVTVSLLYLHLHLDNNISIFLCIIYMSMCMCVWIYTHPCPPSHRRRCPSLCDTLPARVACALVFLRLI
jgi:hypothetical protein